MVSPTKIFKLKFYGHSLYLWCLKTKQTFILIFFIQCPSSSSSIGTATLVGYGLLNYRWVFSAGRFLQSAVASGTSNCQRGGPHSMSNNINLWNSLICSVFHALIRCIKCITEQQMHSIFITFIAIWWATCFSHILFYCSTVNFNQKLYVSLILCTDSDIFLLQNVRLFSN